MTSAPRELRGQRLLKIIAAFVTVLVFMEVGVRVLERRLPTPLLWHSVEAQHKVDQMDRLAARGGASVVLLGTSLVISGINPDIIDASLGGQQRVYNAALASGVPRLMDPWATSVVIPRLHPELLIVGVSSYDLKDDPRDFEFADGFLASPGGRQATGNADALEDADWWLRHHVALWNNRVALRDPANVFDPLRGKSEAVDREIQLMTPSGWLDLPGPFEPILRVNVRNWSIGTRNVSALEHLLETARDDGIRTVLVSLPVTQEFVDSHPHGEDDYRTFHNALTQLADRTGAIALEFDSLRDHKFFVDEAHLGTAGATALTTELVSALNDRHLLPVS